MEFSRKNARAGIANSVLLSLYVALILFLHAFWLYAGNGKVILVQMGSIALMLSFIVCPPLLRSVSRLSLPLSGRTSDRRQLNQWLLVAFIASMLRFLIVYAAYYPGGYSPDSLWQIAQAMGLKEYPWNDWHPVFQTLFAFWVPYKLSGGWVGSVVLFQILLFSAAIAWAVRTMRQYAGKKAAAVALAVYLLNPNTCALGVTAWKDVSFTIGALAMLTCAAHIHFTDGAWIKRPANAALFVFAAVCTTLFRHNAILFTAPLVLAAMFYMPRKSGIAVAAACLVVVLLVKYPLYAAIGVESPGSRSIETLGLPMNGIAAVVQNEPETLDAETEAFAHAIAPQEVWENVYVMGNYNTFKWSDATNQDVIEEYGAGRVLNMFLRCLVRSPATVLKSVIRLTDPVYTITDQSSGTMTPSQHDNDIGVEYHGVRLLQKAFAGYAFLTGAFLPLVFCYQGAMLLLLLVAVLAKCRLNKKKDLRKAALALPVFTFNFGTMLLLTSRTDALRFFHYTFLMIPLYFAIYFSESDEESVSGQIRQANP